jgi:hypothetical protein
MYIKIGLVIGYWNDRDTLLVYEEHWKGTCTKDLWEWVKLPHNYGKALELIDKYLVSLQDQETYLFQLK